MSKRIVSRRMARLVVDFELLAEALGLPESAVLRGVCDSRRFGAVEIKVQHEELPEVMEGAVIPEAWPTFEWCDKAEREILTDWGVR